MSTTSTPEPQPRCPGPACLDAVAATLFRAGRDHHGTPYLEVLTTGDRIPGRLGNRRDVTAVRARLELAHRVTGHAPPSDRALARATEAVLAGALEAPQDVQPLAEALGERVLNRSAAVSWRDGLDALPPGWRVPAPYKVTRGGVFRRSGNEDGEDGESDVRVTYGPVVITAVFTDPDGQKMTEITWLTDDGRWVSRTVPRLVTRSGKRLLTALGDEGLPVIDADAKHVERWLAEAEHANRGVVPDQRIARWLGWQGGGEFIASADGADRYAVRDQRQDLAVRAHRAAGTLQGWQQGIAEFEAWPVAQIVLAGSFAAPLLQVLGLPSTVLDVFYRSSRGKSIAARAAFSVWGDPDIAAGGIAKWSDTAYLLELRLAIARGLPVVIDESQNLGRKTPDAVTALVYSIGNDRGVARGGDYLSSLAWSTVVISTGERSLVTFGDAQGVAPRRIPIGAPPIPTAATPEELQAVKDAIRRHEAALASNFGVAGPAFVSRLIRETSSGRQWILDRHRVLAAHCQGGSDWTARRAAHVAALALAAELAEQWEIVPFPRAPWAVWADVLLSTESFDDEDQATRSLGIVTAALAETPTWVDHGDGRDQPAGGRWIAKVGLVAVGGERRPAVMVPLDIARRWFRAAGADLEAARLTWKDAGILVPFEAKEGGKAIRRWTHKARIAGSSPTPVLVFHPDHVEPPTPPAHP